jgi:hypothetical protein
MSVSRLLTLLYLADRKMLLKYGRTITGDEFINIPESELDNL